jgi:hypothetical protein
MGLIRLQILGVLIKVFRLARGLLMSWPNALLRRRLSQLAALRRLDVFNPSL